MKDKVVLITGAASGIAAATALLFSQRGCLLSLVDRDHENLQVTFNKCVQAGASPENLLIIPADLGTAENQRTIIEKTIQRFTKLDVLLNIAGIGAFKTLVDTDEATYDELMKVNLKAIFFLTQLAIPYLKETKGCVVNVSSVGSQRPAAQALAYCMGKAALDMFTKSVALEVASSGIRVNAVNPSNIKTNFLRGLNVDEIGQKLHALRRPGLPEEIAQAILFLADNESASFITGVTLLVDGGMSLMGPQGSPF